ncbi:YbjQ family protein [Actinomadura harenae]|uniref:Heavy metal-binding domain-containing protein n=1 Tax=Actinomadura harenae TaxID=2483351 RepID=A0A3M2M5F1_9ACTN|nr:hypothetical protein [Actinomadura harenae]RMI44053.1 hypothetical protein EBO15_14120 [Actinomadura harenae]
MIPIYTTDTVPTATGPVAVLHAWPVWVNASDNISRGLDALAQSAARGGAHAIVGMRISSFAGDGLGIMHSFVGTAVVLNTSAST